MLQKCINSITHLYFRAIPVQRYSHINGIIIARFNSRLNQCFKLSLLLKYGGNIVVTQRFFKAMLWKRLFKISV